jgi:UDP-3-O-[3-hydroxymyristoyl] glucosamine N-acyltransferase
LLLGQRPAKKRGHGPALGAPSMACRVEVPCCLARAAADMRAILDLSRFSAWSRTNSSKTSKSLATCKSKQCCCPSKRQESKMRGGQAVAPQAAYKRHKQVVTSHTQQAISSKAIDPRL